MYSCVQHLVFMSFSFIIKQPLNTPINIHSLHAGKFFMIFFFKICFQKIVHELRQTERVALVRIQLKPGILSGSTWVQNCWSLGRLGILHKQILEETTHWKRDARLFITLIPINDQIILLIFCKPTVQSPICSICTSL